MNPHKIHCDLLLMVSVHRGRVGKEEENIYSGEELFVDVTGIEAKPVF